MALRIVITDWAFQSYVDLRGSAFTDHQYWWGDRVLDSSGNWVGTWDGIRADVELLSGFQTPSASPKFQVDRFWGPATSPSGGFVSGGFKMKWRNLVGRNQLRLTVAFAKRYPGEVFLCHAYTKDSDRTDRRQMAKLKDRLRLIEQGRMWIRGYL